MKKIVTAFLLIAVCSAHSTPWASGSTGLDMSYLYWEHGEDCVWGYQVAFGPRIIDNLYFRAKVTIPLPTPIFAILGNQVNAGGEFSWLMKNPEQGFAVKSSIGAAWCLQWPENIIVPHTSSSNKHAYDGADGIRMEALVNLGYKTGRGAIWLDLGIDHRIMDVTRTVEGRENEESFTFTGPHLGISGDLYF
ncbi:MAG: hypothetical protein K8S62_11960 [Candidatus Sabulitectum sp.]|nr:hypothetical protein [Candidatus Sabulitectum sp.]